MGPSKVIVNSSKVLNPCIRSHYGQVAIFGPCYDHLAVDRKLNNAGAAKSDSGEHSAGGSSFEQKAATQLDVVGELDDSVSAWGHGGPPWVGSPHSLAAHRCVPAQGLPLELDPWLTLNAAPLHGVEDLVTEEGPRLGYRIEIMDIEHIVSAISHAMNGLLGDAAGDLQVGNGVIFFPQAS